MKKKILLALALAVAFLVPAWADYTVNGLTISSSKTITPGVWNQNITAAIAYARSTHTPLLLLRANAGCSQCAKLESAMAGNTAFFQWAAQRKLVLAFNMNTDASAEVTAAKNLTPTSLISSSSMPKLAVYLWPATGQTVRRGFVGRTGQMLGQSRSLDLATQLRRAVDSVLIGDSSTAAITTANSTVNAYKGFAVSKSTRVTVPSNARVTLRRVSGRLPTGVTVKYDSASSSVVVSGKPSRAGTYTYTFRLDARVGTKTTAGRNATYTFSVADPATLAKTDANYNALFGTAVTRDVPLVADSGKQLSGIMTFSVTSAGRLSAKVTGAATARLSLSGSWSSLSKGVLGATLTGRGGQVMRITVGKSGTLSATLTGFSNALGKTLSTPSGGFPLLSSTAYAPYVGTRKSTLISTVGGTQTQGTLTLNMNSAMFRRNGRVSYVASFPGGPRASGSTYFLPGSSEGTVYIFKWTRTYVVGLVVKVGTNGSVKTDGAFISFVKTGTATSRVTAR